MKNRCIIAVSAILFLTTDLTAQVKIGDNPTIINPNSLLELESTNKGFVLPGISLSDVNLSDPLASNLLAGTIVYNINSSVTGGCGKGIYLWNGTEWIFLNSLTDKAWTVKGNDSLNSANYFIGTIDSAGLSLRTAGTEAIHIDSLQRVSINNNTAIANLDVTGSIRSSSLAGGGTVMADNNGILYVSPTIGASVQNFDYTIPFFTILPGTLLGIFGTTLDAGQLDLTIDFPTNLTNTNASLSVWPEQDLPDNVGIAFTRIISTSQMKIRFLNYGTTSVFLSGQIHITVSQF